MKVVAMYNFNKGKEVVYKKYSNELTEIFSVIESIRSSSYKVKESEEKTMVGKMLYSPSGLNKAFKKAFEKLSWKNFKLECEYKYGEYLEGYKQSKKSNIKPFREMDFIKPNKKLGVEVQFGKYAFMVYNVCAKMTIFKNLGVIDAGVEIVPVKRCR